MRSGGAKGTFSVVRRETIREHEQETAQNAIDFWLKPYLFLTAAAKC
jgi:hypothetical protein